MKSGADQTRSTSKAHLALQTSQERFMDGFSQGNLFQPHDEADIETAE